jgi:hypothetical protein
MKGSEEELKMLSNMNVSWAARALLSGRMNFLANSICTANEALGDLREDCDTIRNELAIGTPVPCRNDASLAQQCAIL